MIRITPCLLLIAAFVLSGPLTAVADEIDADAALPQAPLQRFIQEMVATEGFSRAELTALFDTVEHRGDVLEAIANPAEAKPWHEYEKIFVTRQRIEEGARFWKRHAKLLDSVERTYGVPAEVLVAIIGVETRYGRHTGRYRILDTLSTLAFDYPPRSSFFREELRQLLILARDEGLDVAELHGSYAGAMGKPQFIASSYRHYAVDFNENGRRDLWNEMPDVIGSVANYLHEHGWRSGEPVAVKARVEDDIPDALLASTPKPDIPVGRLAQHNIRLSKPLPDDTKVSLLAFQTEAGPVYWAGLQNLYVITRYNHSPLYALAVHQLAEAIAGRDGRVAAK